MHLLAGPASLPSIVDARWADGDSLAPRRAPASPDLLAPPVRGGRRADAAGDGAALPRATQSAGTVRRASQSQRAADSAAGEGGVRRPRAAPAGMFALRDAGTSKQSAAPPAERTRVTIRIVE